MTTISSSTSALSSLTSLYATSDGDTAGSTALSQTQQQSLIGMLEGSDSSTASSGIDGLLGTPDTTGSGTDLSAIFDAIQAQNDATTASATGSSSTSATTAPTEQQKAATLMQSVYQSQQSNLFTLLA
jgi:hypothetical protein